MPDTIPSPVIDANDSMAESRVERLMRAILQAGELLPVSGPISAFVFLNNLQALEDLPFEEGIARGARLFGCQPYLTEDRYRKKMKQGRIRKEDLAAVLWQDLGDAVDTPISSLTTRYELRLAMLRYPLQQGPEAELQWFVAETDALIKLRDDVPPEVRSGFIEDTRHWVMRDLRNGTKAGAGVTAQAVDSSCNRFLADVLQRFGESGIEQWSDATWEAVVLQSLWRICLSGARSVKLPAPPSPPPLRHRNALLAATGEDTDALVHELMIRFCAAYCDQGFSDWSLPRRDQGFYTSFCELYRQPKGPPDRWQRGLADELARLDRAGLGPMDSLLESLSLLGVPEQEWEEFIASTALALRGWASMIWQLEVRSDRVPRPAPTGTFAEFLAVRLILERVALAYVAREFMSYDGPLAELLDAAQTRADLHTPPNVEQRAFLLFQLAQLMGWRPETLARLSEEDWTTLVGEIEAFSGLERRRMLQLAFERRFRAQTLDALTVYTKRPIEVRPRPRFQAVFCIDTREESFRRHLEETSPDVETFSAAGFFGVAMYYRGAADAHFAALCPIVVRPKHWVVEDVVYTFAQDDRRRAKTRRALGAATHQVHVGSRSFAGGALLTASLGVLASIPLVARVLFPRLTANVRKSLGHFVQPPPVTRLRLERSAETPGPEEDHIGFTVEEMAAIGERMIREIGFTSFARLVLFLGHGSFCLNNPHKSAYDCGACSGSAGSPNARALAAILNDVRVRQILATRGLKIPADTIFLGGLHNTCDDTISFLDLDLLPVSHAKDLEKAIQTLDEACERNAHERCRRFESAPLNLSFAAAHRHVEERSQDLAQTRPEFGNASNAICIVGRRARTRGLYLDRRSFLVSYDPTQDDPDHAVLARILGAVVPVCEGINLTYYYSYVDSPGWACGTKLPHNVTSMLGVMDGAASDLRLGLPWQGVEIHEPSRLLFVIEVTPETMYSIMERNPLVGRILRNGWVQLSVLDPESNAIRVYHNGEFQLYEPETWELPKAPSSADWYRGWRDHLGFAVISPDGNPAKS